MSAVVFPVATVRGGEATPPGPLNVCKVPPGIPKPFPSVASLNQAIKTTTTVLVSNMPVLVLMSEMPSTTGDESGVSGGVVSGECGGPASCTTASAKVKAQGKGVVTTTATTAHNGKNPNVPAGKVVVTSNTKVLMSP